MTLNDVWDLKKFLLTNLIKLSETKTKGKVRQVEIVFLLAKHA